MEAPGWLEIILAGLVAIIVIFWFRGGIKATMEQSRQAPKDWIGALIPLAGVVLFVILLIMMVR